MRILLLVLAVVAAVTGPLPAGAARDIWRAAPTATSDPGLVAVWEALSAVDATALEGHRIGSVQIPVPGLDLALEEGVIWLEPPVEGKVRGLFVTGAATLSWKPRSRAEAHRLELHFDVPALEKVKVPWFYLWSASPSPLVLAAADGEPPEAPLERVAEYERAKGAYRFHGLDLVDEVLNARGATRGTIRVVFPFGKELLEFSVEPRSLEEIKLRRFGNVADSEFFWWQSISSGRKDGPGVNHERPAVRQADLERLALADALAYSIHLDVHGPSGQADTTAKAKLKLKRRGLDVLRITLAEFLEVSSVVMEDGTPLPHLQWRHDPSETNQEDVLLLRMPEGASFGTELDLTFRYKGHMFDTEIASWSPLRDEDSWYPRNAFEVDGATFETVIRMDPKYDALAVGDLISESIEEKKDGRKVVVFRSPVPEKRATVQFGQFRDAEEELEGMKVHAFVPGALAAGSRAFDTNVRGVAVLTTAREVANALKTIVPLFGPMDGEVLRVSSTTAGYGRGFRSLLLVPTMRYLGTANWEGQMFLAHEVAHQWFGHQVNVASYFRDAWIEEGLAEFASLEYIRQRYGPERATEMLKRYRNHLLEGGPHGKKEQLGPISMGTRLRVLIGRPDSAYSEVVYEKGAYVVEMIRGMFRMIKGDEGAFFEMMRDFVASSRGKRVSTEDFRVVVEKHLGIPMDWFFDQWVYRTGIPRLDVTYTWEKDGYSFTVVQDEATDFQILVPVTFNYGGKKTSGGVLKVKPGTSETFIATPKKAKGVVVNGTEEVLALIDVHGG